MWLATPVIRLTQKTEMSAVKKKNVFARVTETEVQITLY